MIRSKRLRSTRVNVRGRLVEVDAQGYVLGLTEQEAAVLATIPSYERVADPTPDLPAKSVEPVVETPETVETPAVPRTPTPEPEPAEPREFSLGAAARMGRSEMQELVSKLRNMGWKLNLGPNATKSEIMAEIRRENAARAGK